MCYGVCYSDLCYMVCSSIVCLARVLFYALLTYQGVSMYFLLRRKRFENEQRLDLECSFSTCRMFLVEWINVSYFFHLFILIFLTYFFCFISYLFFALLNTYDFLSFYE